MTFQEVAKGEMCSSSVKRKQIMNTEYPKGADFKTKNIYKQNRYA